MLQLRNQTPFSADFALFPNEAGIDCLYMMAKATFKIGSKWTLSEIQHPPQKIDEYLGEPGFSSLIKASDFHPGKAGADILMVGEAFTFEGAPKRQLDVVLQVGTVKKQIRVYGNRRWDRHQISAPEPFVTMPLVYERAYGGTSTVEDEIISAEVRNPVGLGYFDKNGDADIHGSLLPNLECPYNLIRSHNDIPPPANFGPVAPNWQPRVAFSGTYDEIWKTTRAPFLPDDYNSRFMNVAASELQYPGFLNGGEPVLISGMHARGNLKFNLPQIQLVNKIRVKSQDYSTPFVLDTLMLNPNQLELSMVWRSAFACDKKALKVEELCVSLSRQ